MDIKNGKIVKATQHEMYRYWLEQGWDEIMSFPDYLERCVEHGTEIIYDTTTTEVSREETLDAIKELWEKVPTMRLGQLIENLANDIGVKTFYVEDYNLVKHIQKKLEVADYFSKQIEKESETDNE